MRNIEKYIKRIEKANNLQGCLPLDNVTFKKRENLSKWM